MDYSEGKLERSVIYKGKTLSRKIADAVKVWNLKGPSRAINVTVAAALTVVALCSPFNMPRTYAGSASSANASFISAVQTRGVADERIFQHRPPESQTPDGLAIDRLNRAVSHETAITQDLTDVTDEHSYLAGLENRFKNLDSLSRKIKADSIEKKISLQGAAEGVGDVLRYTMVITPEKYSESVKSSMDSLLNKGYRVVKFRNAWGDKFYQGINVVMMDKNDCKFELQYHTPQSFDIKTQSHEFYEIRRSSTATPEERAKAVKDSIEINSLVDMPDRADGVSYAS